MSNEEVLKGYVAEAEANAADLCVLNDKGRLGFCINEQEIYLDKGYILDYGMIKGMYFWADKLMKVEIQTT